MIRRLRRERMAVRFLPLSDDEITGLRVCASRGSKNSTIAGKVVARLLDERDLFAHAAMTAAWLLEACEGLGIERRPPDTITPTIFEKAIGAPRMAQRTLDDCGLGLPLPESER